MSEPFSDKAQSSMNIAIHASRSAMPFIEEDIEIKSEIKAEPTGNESPLFEPQSSSRKRSMDDEISVSEVKKTKTIIETGPRAYNGGPVRQYVPGTPYIFWRHEAVPELEINSKHHQDALENFDSCINNVVHLLTPYQEEDKSMKDIVDWYKHNTAVPAIPFTVFALIGSSGSGKTSTLNNLLGILGLANADAASESVTQNPQSFSHSAKPARFSVTVSLLNERKIENLIKQCITDLVAYVKVIEDGDTDESEFIHDSAESSKQVLDDLFSHEDGLKDLGDAEEFLDSRNLRLDGEVSESALQLLYQQVRERAFSEDINLDAREYKFTAEYLGDLHAKATKFSERGAFAPLVSSIRTQFYSPLLSMGIEIADLPGYTDTNNHLRKTSMNFLKDCSKVILVADLSRCLTTPELKKTLRETIKLKGTENVCLVLRGKETVEKSKGKWTKDECAHLETLERSLNIAKAQLDPDNEDLAPQAKAEVENIELQIREYRIYVRDRVVTDQFSQKEFQNKYDGGKIRVITVGNRCHEHYMRGTNKAILSIDKTGIKELRAYMCETPSKDFVRAFGRHLANHINMLRRIVIWADGPKLPPRDAAMALLEKHMRWNIKEHKASLIKVLMQYKKLLLACFTSKWEEAVQKLIDAWTTKYAARTQGVFIRQGGRHSPHVKGAQTKKPKFVSWTEDGLAVVEDDVLDLLKSTWAAIKVVEGNICQDISDVVEKICHGLEMLDTIGGANLEGVIELFKDASEECIRDIKAGITELKTNLRSTALKSVADEPCDEDSPIFVKQMFKIFKDTFDKFPPKTKNVTKVRMKYIREQVIDSNGPYTMMSNEIATQMVPVVDQWANKVNSRIDKMHGDLRGDLFKSFEGKKMSDARREQIAPAIKLNVERDRASLQADLDGYTTDIF